MRLPVSDAGFSITANDLGYGVGDLRKTSLSNCTEAEAGETDPKCTNVSLLP